MNVAATVLRSRGCRSNRGARSSVMVGRPFLHAHHLAFEHPGSGERMVFTAPLPPDLESVRERFS